MPSSASVTVPTRTQQQQPPTSQAHPCDNQLISGPQEGFAHLATTIEGCIAHGGLLPCMAFDIMLRPPDSESECPWPPSACVCWFYPGALLSPLSPHPCPCPHPHRPTHILPLLFSCVGVGDGVLVHGPCPPACPLPCCPAASTAPCGRGQGLDSPSCPSPVPRPPSPSSQERWLADGTSPPLQACNPIASFSIRKALRQATINKPVGSISCNPAQPSSLAPVYLHPSLPYHE